MPGSRGGASSWGASSAGTALEEEDVEAEEAVGVIGSWRKWRGRGGTEMARSFSGAALKSEDGGGVGGMGGTMMPPAPEWMWMWM